MILNTATKSLRKYVSISNQSNIVSNMVNFNYILYNSVYQIFKNCKHLDHNYNIIK